MRGVAPVVCGSLLAGVVVLLALALVAGAVALVQRGHARHTATVAQAGRLAAQSREVVAKHPDLGLLLALEAGRLDDSVDSRGALLGALEHGSRIRAWLQGFDSPVEATAFSPDGKLLATVTRGRDHALGHGDLASGRAAAAIVAGRLGRGRLQPGRADACDRGRKGPRRAVGRGDKERASGADRPRRPAPAEPGLAVVRYSPDGSVIAAGPQETNHVTLWDAATGRVIGRPIIVEAAGDGRRPVDLLQPGFEADRRPGRRRDRRDLGGRHGAPGRSSRSRSEAIGRGGGDLRRRAAGR